MDSYKTEDGAIEHSPPKKQTSPISLAYNFESELKLFSFKNKPAEKLVMEAQEPFPPKPISSQVHVLFDIDETLIVNLQFIVS